MAYVFSNILGVFIFDEKFLLIDKVIFETISGYKDNKNTTIKNLKQKYSAVEPSKKEMQKILQFFKNKPFLAEFYNKNVELTKTDLKNSVNFDTLLIQSVHAIGEIDTIINKIAKVLREWYELYLPELSKKTESHEKFAEIITRKSRNEIFGELKIKNEDSLGADLSHNDLKPIKSTAEQLTSLFGLKKQQESYIEKMMKDNCPNIQEVAGPMLGAKLIAEVGSLKRLSELPASTVQILGAEKALFRHMRAGAKMPKHGIIVNHPLVSKSPAKMHGKVARALADKISIAAKVDYFKGNFVGNELKNSLIKKFQIDY